MNVLTKRQWVLSNPQYDRASRQLRSWGIATRACPICGRHPNAVPPNLDELPFPDDHDCGLELRLVRLYAAAGIPPLHWRFDWELAEPTTIIEAVDAYIADLDGLVRAGVGLTLVAPHYGTGKTTALVHLLKEGLRRGYSGRLVTFQSVVSAYKRPDVEEFDHELRSLDLVVIDEFIEPKSDAQEALFERVAELVDARYCSLRPIFISGNLSESALCDNYPKIHSRLTEMSDFVEIPSIDFRPGSARQRRLAGAGLSLA